MTFFDKEDFLLCSVVVPKSYPQSQTHAGVYISDGSVFLVTTPFPNPKITFVSRYYWAIVRRLGLARFVKRVIGENYENPLLYVASCKNCIPLVFKLITPSPLISQPNPHNNLPAYNSDPDIYIEKGVFSILIRQTFRTNLLPDGKYECYNKIFELVGIVNEAHAFIQQSFNLLITTNKPFVSPCHIKVGDTYVFTYLDTNSYNDGDTFVGLFLHKSTEPISDTRDFDFFQIKIDTKDFLPWHMSLFTYKGTLYAIVACVKRGVDHRCMQFLGVFDHKLTELDIYDTPLSDINSYRGAACVIEDGTFILYNTSVHTKFRHGHSVDGREVVMAKCNFETLLSSIQNH